MQILKTLGIAIGLASSTSAAAQPHDIPRQLTCFGDVTRGQHRLDATLLGGRPSESSKRTSPDSFVIILEQGDYGSVSGFLDHFPGCLANCEITLVGGLNSDENEVNLLNHRFSRDDLARVRRGESVPTPNPFFSLKIDLSEMHAETYYSISQSYTYRNLPGFMLTNSEGSFLCN